MAKTFISYLFGLFLCFSICSCVSEAGRTDTDPSSTIGSVFIPDSVKPAVVPDTIKCHCPPTKKAQVTPAVIVPLTYNQLSDAVQRIYVSQIGVAELTGNNDGKEVEAYLRSVGLNKGNAWCAAFVHWCLARGGVPNNITGWSPTSLNKNALIWLGHSFYKQPHHADVVSFFFPPKGRIAHTGFFNKDLGNGWYESVEGNTGNNGAIGNIIREGDGVYRKKRSYNATYAISRHIQQE